MGTPPVSLESPFQPRQPSACPEPGPWGTVHLKYVLQYALKEPESDPLQPDAVGQGSSAHTTSEPEERSARSETPLKWLWANSFPRPERGLSPHLKAHLGIKDHTQNILGRLRHPIRGGTKLTANVAVQRKSS